MALADGSVSSSRREDDLLKKRKPAVKALEEEAIQKNLRLNPDVDMDDATINLDGSTQANGGMNTDGLASVLNNYSNFTTFNNGNTSNMGNIDLSNLHNLSNNLTQFFNQNNNSDYGNSE